MFNIQINNFRSFVNEEFNFSRINILIGENSSGKSSFLKFLLASKQSLLTPNNRNLNFTFSGDYVDLANYKECIYYNNDDLNLSFKYTFNSDYNSFFRTFLEEEIDEELNQDQYEDVEDNEAQELLEEPGNDYRFDSKKKLSIFNEFLDQLTENQTYAYFEISKELNKHESIITKFGHFQIGELSIQFDKKNDSEEIKLFDNPTCTLIFKDSSSNIDIVLPDIEYQKSGFLTLIMGYSLRFAVNKYFEVVSDFSKIENKKLEELSIKEISEILFLKIAFLLSTQNYINYRLSKLEFINPIDTKPARVFLTKDQGSSLNIKDIEDLVSFFSNQNSISDSAYLDLNKILKTSGLAEGIEIVHDSRLPVKELKVKVKDLASNIMDVGYGVSLQLPILLKCLLSEKVTTRRGTTIIIEQPEVHLHPKLHAKFIETILSLGNQNTYFIETHSEYLLRKLQVLIKNKEFNLKPSDVSINYLTRENKKTVKSQHIILANGQLQPNLPSDFFDASFELSLNLLS